MTLIAVQFGILTLLVMIWYARLRKSSEAAGAAQRCPRCHTPVGAGASHCPGCGVPLQVYDLVRAPVVEKVVADPTAALHPLVRTDVCVGCGTCVAACPETGAIRLVDHRAIVNLDNCTSQAKCVAACPVGAIVMTTGAAVQRLEVPQLDAHFQSSVPGIYVVGELGGRGLIKNAINEGQIAIEHVAELLPPGRSRPDGDREAWDVIIVGSGPAGLSAGLAAHRLGLRYLILEQGTLAESIRKYPRQKLLLAEPVKTNLYGGLWVTDATKEQLLQVWEAMVARTGLRIHSNERVEAVGRDGAVYPVRTAAGDYRARRVVLAMGRRGTPRRLGVPGEELDKALYDIIEMEAFTGARMLVVGGGDSAVESALGLSNQPGTTVTLSHRGSDFARVKERNRVKLDAAVESGRVSLMLGSRVREIRPGAVAIEHENMPHILPNDYVVIRIGGEPPYPMLNDIGVKFVTKEIALDADSARVAAGG
jgi:thioredoxin reductase